MLKLLHANIGYLSKQNHVLIENVNVELKPGTTTALIGINGSGKSTFLKTLCGIIPVLSGEVYLENIPISIFSALEIAKKIAFVSTDIIKSKHLTAYELTALGRFPFTGKFGILNAEDHNIVENSLQLVGISNLRNKFVDKMSDGERQRLMIARALAQDTEILMLDEPASFLDLENKYLVYDILKRAAIRENKAILYSTHDLNIALKTADNLMVINNKKLLFGNTEDVILAGIFNSIFDPNKIIFDIESLDFQIISTAHTEITFNCENSILKTLITNALSRNAYLPVNHKTHLEISCNTNLHNATYLLAVGGKSEKFSTVGGLIDALPKN